MLCSCLLFAILQGPLGPVELVAKHFRSPDWIMALQVHPNGDEVMVASDQVIRFMDVRTGRIRRSFAIDTLSANLPVLLTPSGDAVVVVHDQTVATYDTQTGQRTLLIPRTGRLKDIDHVAISHDGKTILASKLYGETSTTLIDRSRGQVRTDVVHRHGEHRGSLLLPDNRHLAVWYQGKENVLLDDGRTAACYEVLQLFDLTTGKLVRTQRLGPGKLLGGLVSPDGKHLAMTFERGLRWLDAATLKVVHEFAVPMESIPVAITPDSQYVCVGMGGEILTFDILQRKQVSTMPNVSPARQDVVPQPVPDGRILVGQQQGHVIRVRDVLTQKLATPPHVGPFDMPNFGRFSPDGQTFETMHVRDQIVRWSLTQRPPLVEQLTLKAAPNDSWRVIRPFAHDGFIAASNTRWHLFDRHGRVQREFPLGEFSFQTELTPDGRSMVELFSKYSGRRDGWPDKAFVRQTHLQDGMPRHGTMELQGYAHSLRIAPDGSTFSVETVHHEKLLPSANSKHFLSICNTATHRVMSQRAYPTESVSNVVYRDERTLLVLDHTPKLIDVATGKDRRLPPGYFENADFREGVVVSPNQRWLAGARKAHHFRGPPQAEQVEVWDIWTGQRAFVQRTGDAHAGLLQFSPDSQLLAIGTIDGALKVVRWNQTPRTTKPTATELQTLWDDLATADPRRANQAIGRLAQHPEVTIPFLRERLVVTPAEKVDLAPWLAQLDDNSFRRREQAEQALLKLGAKAAVPLQTALATAKSPEMIERLNRLLARLAIPESDCDEHWLRPVRGVEVLERGGEASTKVLEHLATGEDNPQTRAAQRVLNQRTRQKASFDK